MNLLPTTYPYLCSSGYFLIWKITINKYFLVLCYTHFHFSDIFVDNRHFKIFKNYNNFIITYIYCYTNTYCTITDHYAIKNLLLRRVHLIARQLREIHKWKKYNLREFAVTRPSFHQGSWKINVNYVVFPTSDYVGIMKI